MMARAIDELKSLTREYQLLAESSAILAWDQETYIPLKAVPERGEQLALLNSLAHKRLTSPRVGELLEQCGCTDEHPGGTIETSELDHGYLRELYRRYTREIRLPSSLVEELSRAASAGQAAWATARGNDDFDLFKPHLERLVALTIEKANAVGYSNHPYDALLDEYEPWASTVEIAEIFDGMEESLRSLIERIGDKPQVDDSFLHQSFDIEDQRSFAARVLDDLGYDRTRGRIDETAHPFTTTLGAQDVRITGRFRNEYLGTGLFGLIHEFGHALYELGFAEEIQGNLLATGTSLGIHESQSRLWENVVARSVPFWERYLPVAKEFFPSQLGEVGLEQFTKAVNKVSAGPIRIDADEVSYGMHIILRFRLELALVEGTLKPAEVPRSLAGAFKRSSSASCPEVMPKGRFRISTGRWVESAISPPTHWGISMGLSFTL